MNRARFTVSSELLLRGLHLPVDAVIVGARASDVVFGDVEFIVEHPQLKYVEKGESYPVVCPAVKTETGERIPGIGTPERITFDGWGQ